MTNQTILNQEIIKNIEEIISSLKPKFEIGTDVNPGLNSALLMYSLQSLLETAKGEPSGYDDSLISYDDIRITIAKSIITLSEMNLFLHTSEKQGNMIIDYIDMTMKEVTEKVNKIYFNREHVKTVEPSLVYAMAIKSLYHCLPKGIADEMLLDSSMRLNKINNTNDVEEVLIYELGYFKNVSETYLMNLTGKNETNVRILSSFHVNGQPDLFLEFTTDKDMEGNTVYLGNIIYSKACRYDNAVAERPYLLEPKVDYLVEKTLN